MSFDRPGGPGELDDEGLPPFPGAPKNRPYVPPIPGIRTWDEMLADRDKYDSHEEFMAAMQDEINAARKAAGEDPLPADETLTKPEAKPDASPDETAALRRRIADQDAEISKLKVNEAAQAAEIAGLRTELSERKAADVERDWKDRVRDDKIAAQAKKIEDLQAAVDGLLKERAEGQRNKVDGGPDKGNVGGEPSSAIDRHDHAETNEAADRARPTRRWHLPSNTKISLFASIVGEAAAADHVPTHASDYVGIGVATVSLGASVVAVWREHRENKQR